MFVENKALDNLKEIFSIENHSKNEHRRGFDWNGNLHLNGQIVANIKASYSNNGCDDSFEIKFVSGDAKSRVILLLKENDFSSVAINSYLYEGSLIYKGKIELSENEIFFTLAELLLEKLEIVN